MEPDRAAVRARIETALADQTTPDPADIAALLIERDQLAHDLRCERYGRRLAEGRLLQLDNEEVS